MATAPLGHICTWKSATPGCITRRLTRCCSSKRIGIAWRWWGHFGTGFARDLSEPRRWQSLYDQPEVRFWGPILNDYANPWPIDWNP